MFVASVGLAVFPLLLSIMPGSFRVAKTEAGNSFLWNEGCRWEAEN